MSEHEAGDFLIHTVRLNREEGYQFYDEREGLDGSIFEGLAMPELKSAVYRFGVREYGRCTGKVFQDTKSGIAHVGWAFEKREWYEGERESGRGAPRTYLAETWLTLECVVEPARPTTVKAIDLGGRRAQLQAHEQGATEAQGRAHPRNEER